MGFSIGQPSRHDHFRRNLSNIPPRGRRKHPFGGGHHFADATVFQPLGLHADCHTAGTTLAFLNLERMVCDNQAFGKPCPMPSIEFLRYVLGAQQA